MTRRNGSPSILDMAEPPPGGPSLLKYRAALLSLRARGIRSLSDLLRQYPHLTPYERFAAICLFGLHKYRRATPLLFRELTSTESVTSGAASAALASIGGGEICARLLRILSHHRTAIGRGVVLSALANLQLVNTSIPLVDALIETLGNDRELPENRAIAAEGLMNAVKMTDRRTRAYRRAVSALLNALRDSVPEVRYFAAFAPGRLREKRALDELRRLVTTDRAVCPGMPKGRGAIRKAAKEAIAEIAYRRNRGARRNGG